MKFAFYTKTKKIVDNCTINLHKPVNINKWYKIEYKYDTYNK